MKFKATYTIEEYFNKIPEINGHKPNLNEFKRITCAFTPSLAHYIGVLDNEDETIVPMSKQYFDNLDQGRSDEKK
jgi:hypothetical protein